MELTQLATFVAVAETGSFSRAAERLFTTQPAISKRVAALEDELGVRLLDRSGRGVLTTEAGEVLLGRARRVLEELDDAREAVRSLSGEVSGSLRLATSHHVGIHRLPPVLKAFAQAHPGVELDLVFLDSERACADVAEGRLEFAVVTLPERPDPTLETRLVWPDPLAIVAATDHPLAEAGEIEPARLGEYPAVLPGRGTVTRTILLDALVPFGVAPRTRLETNYLETIRTMVSVGLGWSVLPVSMLEPGAGDVRAVPVRGLAMGRRLGWVRRRDRTARRVATAFAAMLDAMAPAPATPDVAATPDAPSGGSRAAQ